MSPMLVSARPLFAAPSRMSAPPQPVSRPIRPAAERPEPAVVELTDAQWAAIAPHLPPTRRCGRRRTTDLRRVVAAIHHRWQTGCPWRELPPGFPPWPTVYTYFRNWLKDGTLRHLRTVLAPPKPSQLPLRRSCPPAPRPDRLDPDRPPSPRPNPGDGTNKPR